MAETIEKIGTLRRLGLATKWLEMAIRTFAEEGIAVPEPVFESDLMPLFGPNTLVSKGTAGGFHLMCGMRLEGYISLAFVMLTPDRHGQQEGRVLSYSLDERDNVLLMYDPDRGCKRELVVGKNADSRGWLDELWAKELEGKLSQEIDDDEVLATIRFMARKLKTAVSG